MGDEHTTYTPDEVPLYPRGDEAGGILIYLFEHSGKIKYSEHRPVHVKQ